MRTRALVVTVLLIGAVVSAGLAVFASEEPDRWLRREYAKELQNVRVMNAWGRALERYRANHDRYPPGTSLSSLRVQLDPEGRQDLMTTDGWGHPFHYTASSQGEMAVFALVSTGADGILEPRSSRLLAAASRSPAAEAAQEVEFATPRNIQGSWVDYLNEDVVFVQIHFLTRHPENTLTYAAAPKSVSAMGRHRAFIWAVVCTVLAVMAIVVHFAGRARACPKKGFI
jgi:hypothetical protein